MILNIGSDTSTFRPDGSVGADYSAPDITGPRVVLEGVARTIMTPLRSLFWALNTGVVTPVQRLQNGTWSDADLVRIALDWSGAAKEQVDGVARCTFRLRRATDGKGINYSASVWTEDGKVYPLVGFAADVIPVLFPATPA